MCLSLTSRGKAKLLEKELLRKERLWSLSSHSCSDDHSHTA